MSEKEIVKAIEKFVGRQNGNWSFVRGRNILSKKDVLVKLKTDRKFRSFMVRIVVAQTIEILNGSSI